jgi:Mg-chelatase subunit ChlD
MNEDQTTLNPVGDDAMEARIVAWVLGQSSAFEAAELETWCETHPEWRVYQRRMLALHGLLGQAVQPSADSTWKLSDQRRAALDGILGTKDVVVEAKQQMRKKRWWPQLAKFAALWMVILSVAYTAFLGIFGKVGGKASMSPEVASYSREMPAEMNSPMAPSVEMGNGDDFGDGWAEKKERQTVAKRMAAPMDAPVATDGSLAFQKSEDQLATLSDRDNQVMTKDESGSVPKPSPASAPAAARAIVTATDKWYSKSEGDITGSVMAGKQIDQMVGGGGGEKTAEVITDPIPASAAIPEEEAQQGDEVRRRLYVAEEKFNLGQADEAKKKAEELLRIDANNKDARHILEDVAASKTDYYRSAYDHTRAEMLTEVDEAWELAVPPSAPGQPNADQLKAVDKFWGFVASGDVTVETKGKEVTANGGVLDSKQEELFDLDLREKNRALEVAPNSPEPDRTSFNVEIFNQGAVSKSSITVLPNPQPASTTPKPLPVLDEISTTTEAYSTFSLRVSDASFKLSQAALARGERPAPESVRVEEFYNAFDYGDPVPSAKEPVSCFMEQAAHPLFASRNLVRVSMRTAAAGRSAGQPLHLTLLVDQSGSMVRADRSAVMNAAIAELTTLLGPQDQVSIVGFARTPRLIAEKIPGNEGERIRKTLAEIPSDGGTNLEQAMALALEISQRHMQRGAQNRILLMTDGAANLGNAKPEELAERVKSMRQSGLAFDIAGIGTDGLNDELLLELARHGNGRYYVVNRLTDASDGFAKQLAGAFRPAAENVKVQVQFNPERVSRYRLIGFEKDRLKTEDFRNDAVDAAELAAAEAGQAIYQVELLPEGRGDIGEVSVRFRDTASAQMVERKWTIAHQPSAPAWDRASPSMQLAGLAMFAGEKLKGGAVGEMVTFQDWQALRANVQQYYRQNPRVAQLMDMIRKIEP